MAQQLANRRAIITGGAAGIGAACVRRFISEDALVLIADRDVARGTALAQELGENAAFQPCDASEEADFKAAIDKSIGLWGGLDILVNNAGIALPASTVQETSLEDFERLVKINLRSVFLGCRLAYPFLLKSRGCVLNISSMAGVLGQERHAVYAATKGAINALTKSTAVDWGNEGIRINALCPMGVWTESLRAWSEAQPDPASCTDYLNRIHALGYCPEADEIASVAAFLCSKDAGFVTGCIMPVSGGGECGYKI